MIIPFFILTALVLVVLQTTICMPTPVWPAAPDLYFVLVAYLAYRMDLLRGMIIIFFLGCFLDVFSGTILGMYSLLCFGTFFFLRFISQKMPVSESLYQIPMIGVSYLVVYWISYVLLATLSSITADDADDSLYTWVWWEMLVRALLVVLFSYLLFRFFEFFHARLRKVSFSWKRLRIQSDNRYRS